MRSNLKLIFISISIIIITLVVLFLVSKNIINNSKENLIKTDESLIIDKKSIKPMKFIVVKVTDKFLGVISIEDKTKYNVSYSTEGNIGFKKGQEILVYSTQSTFQMTSPSSISQVEKIKIIKENTDITIPEDVLRYYYSSRNNVNISINSVSDTSIELTIEDSNEYPYIYSNSYSIFHNIKNKEYTGIGYQIGENTKTTTAGYSRNRF